MQRIRFQVAANVLPKLRAKFLEEGNKVKITLRFRGNSSAGLAQLQKIEADVAEIGVEQAPKWKAVKWVCYLDRKVIISYQKHRECGAFY